MQVRNVHRRPITSGRVAADLVDGLASSDDRLWPHDRWPAMRLDRGLEVGSRGGHGPVRYHVVAYEAGRSVRFRFDAPRGFDGTHGFDVVDRDGDAELVHVLEARLTGPARLSWPLVFRPLHDALIEDALDRAVRATGEVPDPPARWSRTVRLLRWYVTRRRRRAV